MTSNTPEPTVEGFFENVGGGTGAPSAKLKDLNDFVQGEIVSQRIVDYIPFGKTDPEVNKDGSIRKQLVVVLQTDQRNWQGVSKVPVVDRDVPLSQQVPKDPSEDDGTRAVYLPQWSNIQAAVAEAVRKTNGGKNGPLRDGGKLGVKVAELKDTGKGNPLKIHAALYEPPAASDAFFSQAPTAEQPAAAAPAPAAEAAPAAPAAQAAPTDPWTGQPAAQGEAPPF